jgi:hypothetical protein
MAIFAVADQAVMENDARHLAQTIFDTSPRVQRVGEGIGIMPIDEK